MPDCCPPSAISRSSRPSARIPSVAFCCPARAWSETCVRASPTRSRACVLGLLGHLGGLLCRCTGDLPSGISRAAPDLGGLPSSDLVGGAVLGTASRCCRLETAGVLAHVPTTLPCFIGVLITAVPRPDAITRTRPDRDAKHSLKGRENAAPASFRSWSHGFTIALAAVAGPWRPLHTGGRPDADRQTRAQGLVSKRASCTSSRSRSRTTARSTSSSSSPLSRSRTNSSRSARIISARSRR